MQKFLEVLLCEGLRKTVCLLEVPLEDHQSLDIISAKEPWRVIPGGSFDSKRFQ